MGKSRRRSGDGSSPTQDYSENNKKILVPIIQEIIEMSEDDSLFSLRREGIKARAKSLQEFLEYCNKNNIEILESTPERWVTYGIGRDFTPRLTMVDHNDGRTYKIYDDTNERLGDYKDWVDSTRKLISKLPKDFTEGVQTINFVDNTNDILSYSILGKYHRGTKSISIARRALSNNPLTTGSTGTIIHEMAHSYDWWKLGKGKGYGSSDGKITPFGKYGLDRENEYGPTKYATEFKYETTSTVFEQVYTKTLRPDATMKNGSYVNEAFRNKYGKDGNDKELYQFWYNEWSDLTIPAENILK